MTYLAAGRSIIPLLADKKPMVKWRDLQTRLATEQEVREWFKPGSWAEGLAMILGRVSGGLWVMDADGPAAVEWMKENAPPTTVYVNTRRGRHAYYRMPDGVEIRNRVNIVPSLKKESGCQIDIKGERGYVVIPPTPHSEGFYEWELKGGDLPVWEPPIKPEPSAKPNIEGAFGHDLSDISLDEYLSVVHGERNVTLAHHVGMRFAAGESLENVIYWALGWNSSKCKPPQPEADVINTVESIAKRHFGSHGEPLELPPAPFQIAELQKNDDAGEVIPPQILHPGGILEEIMDYVEISTVASFPIFSLAAAICLVGTLLGHKIQGETGLPTHFYIICLAPSGTGKNAPLSAIPRLLRHCNCSEYLGPNTLASSAALIAHLDNKQARGSLGQIKPKGCLIFQDEIGDVFISAKGVGSPKSDLTSLLKELYSRYDGVVSKKYKDSTLNNFVYGPHLSLYGTGVARRFWEAFSPKEMLDGFLARLLILNYKVEIQKPREPNFDIPESLANAIKKMAAIPTNTTGKLSQWPAPRMIQKTVAAKDYFAAQNEQLRNFRNQHSNQDMASIYNRVTEYAHKTALVHAASLAGGVPDAVDIASAEYAWRFILYAVDRMAKMLEENISHGPIDDLQKRILATIKKRGSATLRIICKNLHNVTSKQVKDALEMLQMSGKVIRLNDGRWACPKETTEN